MLNATTVQAPLSPTCPTARISDEARITPLHRLRGVAALIVVVGHSFNAPALVPAQNLLAPSFILISSGTTIFVLIAGILFGLRILPKLADGRLCTLDILKRRGRELAPVYLGVGGILTLIVAINMQRLTGPPWATPSW